MRQFILTLWQQVELSLPLFSLVLIGYLLIRVARWPKSVADGLTRFVFSLAMPVMLFRLMASFDHQSNTNIKVLVVFFGGCLIVFIIGRLMANYLFNLDGVSGSVFSLGGIFSNNVMLGLPVATILIGKQAIATIALVLLFNALILWTLVTISVEWARNGSLSLIGFSRTLQNVVKNPIILGILSGSLFKLSGLQLPYIIDQPTNMIAQMAAPLSLLALGMGLAEYRMRDSWQMSVAICLVKLLIMPSIVWLLAKSVNLPLMETKVVVLLGSMAIGANVYLMARQFDVLIGTTAASLVLSTIFAAFTTPLIITIVDFIE